MADEAPARIDPWSSQTYSDYGRLREQFGIDAFDSSELPDPIPILRRGIVFGQRDFGRIATAINRNDPFCILTGLMPSGRMHLGHKLVIDSVNYYQKQGADVYLAVADIESFASRDMPLAKAREIAIEEYLKNYIALGLADTAQVYFQSEKTDVRKLGLLMSRKVNWSTMKSIYGFGDSTNLAHVQSPIVQVGDILHVQLEKYGGPRPTLVPVGVDQDPHLRLTRDLAFDHRLLSVKASADGKVGIFAKTDHDVESLLNKAKAALQDHWSDYTLKVRYKALYVKDATPDQVGQIDDLLHGIEVAAGGYGFFAPSSTYHRFMTGITGGKMSSSKPNSAIFLTDGDDEVTKKVRSAKTGGAVSEEEQRRNGADPYSCVVFELFTYHFAPEDAHLKTIEEECQGGTRMCGPCKQECTEAALGFFKDLREKRDAVDEAVLKEYLEVTT